mgnify:CR=1 FL=1
MGICWQCPSAHQEDVGDHSKEAGERESDSSAYTTKSGSIGNSDVIVVAEQDGDGVESFKALQMEWHTLQMALH